MISWNKTPALFVALLTLIGMASAFFYPLLFFIFCTKRRLFWLITFVMLFYVKLLYLPLPKEETGTAYFHIEEVKRHAGPVKMTWVYSGNLKTFQGDKTYRNIPVRIYLPLQKKRPPANLDYSLQGTLTKISTGHYLFKTKGEWIPIENTSNLAEWRFQQKEKVKKWVHSRFKEKQVATLFSALATGNLESRYLAYHFNQVGLQHLLAISGFHFALLSFFLAFLLKRFLPEKWMALILILLLSSYFLYMGGAPSINRAWIGVILYLIALVFHLRPSPLNALGVALLASLFFDPLVITRIGFQLSFGATLGILLFYRILNHKLEILFPKRPYTLLKKMSFISQSAYLLCTYLRSAFALQGAVLTFTLPLLLFHFQTFPLASFFYNLFVPLLFSILLALFLLHLDILAAPFAQFLLTLIENTPKKLLFSLTPLSALLISVPFLTYFFIKNRTQVISWISEKCPIKF